MKRLDAIAAIGEYKDTKTGEMKKRYLKCGMVMVDDEGSISFKIDAVPVGKYWDGWINAKEPYDGEKPARQSNAPTRKSGNGFDDMKDDIPF
jgi:hypothetical protein